MNPTFGARLRLRREERAIPLSAIAADTKIKQSLLEALEHDDVSQWPTGIFRKAYIRSYAQAIGLDPGDVVREFLELYPDPAEVIPAPEAEAEASQGSHHRLRRLVTSAIAAVPAFHGVQRRDGKPALAPSPSDYVVRAPRQDGAAPAAFEPEAPSSDAARPDGSAPEHADADERSALIAEDEFVLVPPPVAAEASDSGGEEIPQPTLADAARLCGRLARVVDRRDLTPVLEDAAAILDAVGLVVWSWDGRASALRPSLAHGYPDAMLARMPVVDAGDDNAIAAAFRSGEPCVVNGGRDATGAAVVPIVGPSGCVGVLALEVRNGGEQREPVRALAEILAAQLVTLLGSEPMAEAATA